MKKCTETGKPSKRWKKVLLRILLTAAILLCVTVGILIPTVERRRSRAVSDAVARYSEELETVRTSLTVSEELKAAYGVFLEMYRLDPAEPEQLEQIHGLYKGLKEDLSEDTLYRALYEAWGALLPQLDAEAASRAATTEPETTPEETEETPPETDENGNPVPPAEGGGEQPQQ